MLLYFFKTDMRMSLGLVFQELNIDVCDVESLLVQCILDKYVFFPLESAEKRNEKIAQLL